MLTQQFDKEVVRDSVVEAIRSVFDPEIPVNVYDLGMIYDVDVDDEFNVKVTMTLTSPACPVAESLPGEVEVKVVAVDGVNSGTVNLVWDPPWDPGKMSEAAKLQLGML